MRNVWAPDCLSQCNVHDILVQFVSHLLNGSLKRRLAITSRWLMSNPIAGGTIVADGIYQFMQSMLYAPGKFVVKRDSINFFDCEHLAIHRTWLLAGEQRVLDWLFVHREDIFEKVAMKPNDRFILEGIKGLSADALLPTQLRRKVVRDASYYLCMRMPSMQQHLLQSAQRLMIKSDQGRKDEFVFHLQHALQQTPKCIERMVTVYPPDI